MKSTARIPGVRFFGASVLMHWSVLVFALLVMLIDYRRPANGVMAIVSYLALIALHEAGHAFVASRVGARPFEILIGMLHGHCRYHQPYYAKYDYLVAWGGVLAQLAVAIPVLVLHRITGFGHIDPLGPIVAILGYASLLMAAFNLLPLPFLDGGKAWKLPPLLWKEWRATRMPLKRRGRKWI